LLAITFHGAGAEIGTRYDDSWCRNAFWYRSPKYCEMIAGSPSSPSRISCQPTIGR
jgi:hypothetical protein